MLDRDLAEFYGVETKVLNQAVKRNIERFPGDFMFKLTKEEAEYLVSQNVIPLRSQIVTLKKVNKRGFHIKYSPYVFTEHGIAMLSSVLKSKKAVQINIAIMRVFVMVSRIINSSKDLAEKISELEKKHDKHDKKIKDIFSALHYLIKDKNEEENNKKEIGFRCK